MLKSIFRSEKNCVSIDLGIPVSHRFIEKVQGFCLMTSHMVQGVKRLLSQPELIDGAQDTICNHFTILSTGESCSVLGDHFNWTNSSVF